MPDLGYNRVNIFRAEQDVPCLGHNKVILLRRDDLIRRMIGREPDLDKTRWVEPETKASPKAEPETKASLKLCIQ